MRYLPRPRELEAVRARLRRAPVTALLGPRQCGKTTLARWGMEFKYQDAPGMTRSIRAVLRDLPLRHLWIVYPGPERCRLDEAVSVVPLADLTDVAIAHRR